MHALYKLVKDILFIIYICSALNIPLLLPAVIMEDNSAVVTVSNEESAYLKKCKHFIMVVRARATRARFDPSTKDQGRAEQHTKKRRDKSSFATKAANILGSPAKLDTSDSETEADTEDEY